MKIIYVHQYAGIPNQGKSGRVFSFCTQFAAMGHEVYLVTSAYSHLRITNKLISDPFEIQIIDGINVVFINCREYSPKSVSRILSSLDFGRGLKNNQLESCFSSADWVIEGSTYALSFRQTRRLARRINARFCYEIRDLWPLSLADKFKVLYLIAAPVLERYQRYIVKRSHLVVSNLKGASSYLESIGAKPNAFGYVANGFDRDLYARASVSKPVTYINDLKKNGNFIVGYAGSIGLQNSVDILVECAERLKEESIHFVVVGDGEVKDSLVYLCDKKRLSNVTFVGAVNKSKVYGYIELFDIGWVGGRSVESHKYGVSPNKVYDYFGCGANVLFSLDAETDFGQLNRFVHKPASMAVADIVQSIVNARKTIHSSDKENIQALLEDIEYSALSQAYLDILSNKGLS
jgi:glycosyltransferase involved in cell wall biosynthesis